ncbi:hypothetical protein QJQ45_008692, partial [Haematococcus lacustris]
PSPSPLNAAEADILIAACGKAEYVTADWVKPGAAVVDVGINAVDDASRKAGYRLVGDVEFQGAAAKASWITPVPGGVGPMTIAMLLKVNNRSDSSGCSTAAAASAALVPHLY